MIFCQIHYFSMQIYWMLQKKCEVIFSYKDNTIFENFNISVTNHCFKITIQSHKDTCIILGIITKNAMKLKCKKKKMIVFIMKLIFHKLT